MSPPREPNELRFLVLGAGMAGLLAAIELRKAGYPNVVVYEKADRLGGTWRENTYPGIACDVPSHLYSYSFAPNPDWSHRFSPGAEIQAYFEGVARAPRGAAGASSASARRCAAQLHRGTLADRDLDQRHRRDEVRLRDRRHRRPAPPEPARDPGPRETSRARSFHSARWDHDVPLEGRRVGVIGTGSTAVQIVVGRSSIPQVAKLSLFQRTAQWIMPLRTTRPTRRRRRTAFRRRPGGACDALRDEPLAGSSPTTSPTRWSTPTRPQMRRIEQLCRANLETTCVDPALRERLRPELPGGVQAADRLPRLLPRRSNTPTRTLVTDEHRAGRGHAACGPGTDGCTSSTCSCWPPASGSIASCAPSRWWGSSGVTAGRRLGGAADPPTCPISIPELPEPLHAERPERSRRQLLADRGRRAAVRLHRCSSSTRCVRGDCPRGDQRDARRRQSPLRPRSAWRRQRRTRSGQTGCRSWYLDDRGVPAVWPWTFDRFREVMATPDLRDYDLA